MPKSPDPADRAKAGHPPDPEADYANGEDVPPPSDDDGPRAGDAWGRPPRPPPGARRDADRSPAEQAARRAERFAAGKLGNLTGDALARMRRRRDGEDKPVPLPWTRTSDELHGGLWPGCWILVGGTGVGKSQWAFAVAYNAAVRHGVPVAYVGLELDETGLVARLAALGMHGRTHPDRVPWSGLYLGRGNPDPLRWFDGPGVGADVLAELDAAPFYLSTGEARGGASGWSYREISRLAADLRAAHPDGPALLVVDFLQLVGGDPEAGREDLRERIANAAYAGRMAARKHGISVLLLSATARGYYSLFAGKGAKAENIDPLGDGDPGRFLGTGKESGETEYAADGVLALCRGPWLKGNPPPDVWLAVAKSRTGRGPRAGWCCYGFDGTAFTEKDPPAPEAKPEATPPGSTGNGRGSREAGTGSTAGGWRPPG